MKRARSPRRCLPSCVSLQVSRRVISLCVCLALTLSCLTLVSFETDASKGSIPFLKRPAQQNTGPERRVPPLPPRTDAPAANLPNLDVLRSAAEANRQNPQRVEAPRPIPSTLRSRKKSLPPGMQRPGTRISQTNSVHTPGLTHASVQTTRSILRESDSIRSHHVRLRKAVNAMTPVAPVLEDRMNVALAANGGVASSSSNYNDPPYSYTAAGANNGVRSGAGWLQGEGWNDAAPGNTFPDWLQIDFNGNKAIDEVSVFTVQDNWENPVEPTETLTFSLYGLTGFEVQYWNGSAWATVPGGSVSNNNKVWKRITFSQITTSKIRVLTTASGDGYSRLTEVEAWGPAPPRTNVALAANGGMASSSSNYNDPPYSFTAAGANNGIRNGSPSISGEAWNAATPTFPQWLQVDFSGLKTIDEIDVFTVQDNWQYPSEPTEAMTFSLYGLTGFDVQYWNGGAWATVPGGNVSNNNKVWKKITFTPIITTKIRVLTSASPDGYSRIAEVEAWTAAATNSGSTPSDVAMARLDPRNRTGTGGEDLLSNNVNWNLPLVGLPGRGPDLGLTLSYNSLVWTRSGNNISFDLDQGSIAPGFRLGFPTVEGPYWNNQANANFYLLVTPSGGRVELRQVGTSDVYEAKDASYLQLTDNSSQDFSLLLRSTDGSQLRFEPAGGGWRCKKITDRNGNFITATYKSWGEIETVTDTLGRVIRFVYDTNDNLSCITQGWNGQPAPTTCAQSQPQVWATFGWGTAPIGNNFPDLTKVGPNSTSIPVLTQVGLPDGSRYTFGYNAKGQVSNISRAASDNLNHSYKVYEYNSPTDDCPRLTQTRTWAANWSDQQGVPHEVATSFGHDADGGCRLTLPDGTVYKEFYGNGWQSGLTTETRNFATVADANANVWQKKTTTTWTQDNIGVGYLSNPRVTETNIYDSSGNRRRTTVDYGAYAQWGLPHIVKEYAGDGTNELRRTQTDYNLDSAYITQRIIGLVSSHQVYDAVLGQWLTKITYGYDDPAKLTSQAANATQHESSYSQTFTTRGNVTSVSRWDVTDINNVSEALTSTVTYNAAGSVLSSTDPANHTSYLYYDDSFSDAVNHNTFAYPTKLRDADGFDSLVQYNFDFGAKTRVQTPLPNVTSNQPGPITTFAYDNAGRIQQVTSLTNDAYTRYVYGADYVESFSTVNNVADEAYTFQLLNGRGQVFIAGSIHPGSTGGYRAQVAYYDVMGRVMKQSNPTEINNTWAPVGDDAAGWQYNNPTEYDWQGRPKKLYNTDGTYKEASYTGCGCAGGEVVTLTDEVGRRQKVYSDVLGRTWKNEILNWDGTVYSATTNSFNARDQVTLVRQWAGAENGGGAYQDTTMSFDGYGRLWTKHVPEQNSGTYTSWEYNHDDTLHKVTDARGASATYVYNNNRHLVNGINYLAPSGVATTPNVTFEYDAAGNRTLMNDGLGSVSYGYNQMSRMTSETRTITGVGNYTIGYDYNLAGQMKSITDPAGAVVNYSFDSAGRPSSVTGSSFGGVTTYASGPQYRAWGALKSLTYGNNRTMSAAYNSRLQTASISGVTFKTYQYFADGSLRYSQDLVDDRFDRSYTYDHTSRVSQALSGPEARGESPSDNRPYNQSFAYDAFNHLTSQVGQHWSSTSSSSNSSFVNNRRVGSDYDADGNVLSGDSPTYIYNAAGQRAVVQWGSDNTVQEFDGNGLRSKTTETTFTNGQPSTEVRYEVRSTVLGGQVVTELNASGGKQRTFVYAGKQVLAWQRIMSGVERVTWEHRDPSNASFRTTNEDGTMNWQTYVGDGAPAELDPTGANADVLDPYLSEPPPEENQSSLISYGSFGNASQLGTTYSLDGVPVPADEFVRVLNGMLHGSFGMLDHAARDSSRVVGYRNSGVRWGRPFEVNYDANGRMTSMNEWGLDSSLAGVSYGNHSPVYASSAWNQLANLLDSQSAYATAGETASTSAGQRRNLCPPTAKQLAHNPTVKKTLREAARRAGEFLRDRGHWVEHGGWVYQNRTTGEIVTELKTPAVSPPLPKNHRPLDDGYNVYLGNPPSKIGFNVVGVLHIHVENSTPNENDDQGADDLKVPGILGTPDGKTHTYGTYRRGIFRGRVPPGC